MLTFAMYLKDEPPEKMMLLINTNTQQSEVEMHVGLNVVSHVVQQDAPNVFVAVQNNNLTEAGAIHPVWAALYEGEYTAANLPFYKPKGYAAELRECQRYFIHDVAACVMGTQYNAANGLAVVRIPRMRGYPTFTLRGVQSQGWGTIELAKFSKGWTYTTPSGFVCNFLYSGTEADRARFIGAAFALEFDASADL